MQTNTHPENPFHARHTYTFAKMHQLRAMTCQLLPKPVHSKYRCCKLQLGIIEIQLHQKICLVKEETKCPYSLNKSSNIKYDMLDFSIKLNYKIRLILTANELLNPQHA